MQLPDPNESFERPHTPAPLPQPACPAPEGINLVSFETTPETDKLDMALSKAQGEIQSAVKDALNPHFNQAYADLASVWNACRAPLSKHGISVTQWPLSASRTKVELMTRVAHGGQWMLSAIEMPVDKPTAQGVGSALTYARRYMLSAIIGIAPDDDDLKDDDGNAASGLSKNARNQNSTALKAGAGGKPQGTQQNATTGNVEASTKTAGGLTQAQLSRLFAIAEQHSWTHDQIKIYFSEAWGVESTKTLNKAQYDAFVKTLETVPFPQAILDLKRD